MRKKIVSCSDCGKTFKLRKAKKLKYGFKKQMVEYFSPCCHEPVDFGETEI